MDKIINIKNIKDIKQETILKQIKNGDIFIYPTDTVYGMGCDATNKTAVNKIKKIKSRDKIKPLSVIAPSITWIKQHCITPKNLTLSKYLPGPYTLILKKKREDYLKHVSDIDTLGVRIPNNEFIKIIQKTKKPFITTSVNLAGEKAITKISETKKQIKKHIHHIIDAGPLTGKPSTLIINGKEIKR